MKPRFSRLSMGLVLASLAGPVAAQEKPVAGQLTLEHQRNFTKGSYLAFSFAFATLGTDLAVGRDYDAVWKLAPATFPANSTLDWFVPAGQIPGGKGVWGIFHIAYGNYDSTRQQIAVTPRQVRTLTEFQSEFDWAHAGSTNFNLLHEFFLTRTARPQPQTVHRTEGAIEVGFFLHVPDVTRRFHLKGAVVGPDHVNRGVAYSVRRNRSYITFAPAKFGEQLKGSIDWKAALDYLATQGAITGDEYVNGIGFGVEPTQGGGKGQMTVHRYQVTFK